MPASSSSPRFDWRNPTTAFALVLLLRLVLGLWALPISAQFPDTPLEQHVGLKPQAPWGRWLQRVAVAPYLRYDALHYETIVQRGYSLHDGTASFHPLYPLLAKPIFKLTGSAALSLMLVSLIATTALGVVMARYTFKFHGPQGAQTATWLFMLGPLGFVLLLPYTESTFLLWAVACLWAMRDNRWLLAGAMGALACLTRQQGLALLVPLVWCVWQAARKNGLKWQHGVALLLPIAGYGSFSLYRILVLGDGGAHWPRALLVSDAAQHIVAGQHIAPPWQPLLREIALLNTPAPYSFVFDLTLGLGAVLLLALGWRQLHPTERCYGGAITMLSLCYFNGPASPLLSLPRHMMLAFPLLFGMAKWASSGPNSSIKTRWMLQLGFIINLLLAGAFVRHGWVP